MLERNRSTISLVRLWAAFRRFPMTEAYGEFGKRLRGRIGRAHAATRRLPVSCSAALNHGSVAVFPPNDDPPKLYAADFDAGCILERQNRRNRTRAARNGLGLRSRMDALAGSRRLGNYTFRGNRRYCQRVDGPT